MGRSAGTGRSSCRSRTPSTGLGRVPAAGSDDRWCRPRGTRGWAAGCYRRRSAGGVGPRVRGWASNHPDRGGLRHVEPPGTGMGRRRDRGGEGTSDRTSGRGTRALPPRRRRGNGRRGRVPSGAGIRHGFIDPSGRERCRAPNTGMGRAYAPGDTGTRPRRPTAPGHGRIVGPPGRGDGPWALRWEHEGRGPRGHGDGPYRGHPR